MSTQTVRNGLLQLGFNSGWVITGGEITFWENPAPQPSMNEIFKAAEDYVEPELTINDKLAIVGLSLSDLRSALGLE